MGKRKPRRLLCSDTGKVVHFSIAGARQVAATKATNLRAYKCKHCGFFHLHTRNKKASTQ